MREIPAFTIALVAGARPNFMKVVPVYHALAAGKEGAQGIQAGQSQ
jgi:UDP-N-acetylglucosamine 2-epimerase